MEKAISCFLCCLLIVAAGAALAGNGAVAADIPAGPAPSEAPPLPPPPEPPSSGPAQLPPLQMIGPGIFEIGYCRIDKKEKRVELPAVVNMDKGLLEYLLVGEGGKVHESLLRTKVDPYALQIALLLVGLEGTVEPLAMQGAPQKPTGDQVEIRLRWQESGQEKTAPIGEWVRLGEKQPPVIPWVFTGSLINNGVFVAQVDKSIIAVFHDPVAMIDHQLPEGATDETWFVNEAKVRPVGSDLTVVIAKK